MNTSIPHILLSDAEIHIWQVHLRRLLPDESRLAELLGSDELERAGRYRFPDDRSMFTTSRALLRLILEAYGIGLAKEIRFAYSARGKPSLAPQNNAIGVHFNVSHSGDVALFAFAINRSVGVDVEKFREVPEVNEIVDQFFSAKEREAFFKLSDADRPLAFFKGWTRKEAVLKAMGEGLDYPIEELSVALNPGISKQEILLDSPRTQPKKATVFDLAIDPAYAAAVSLLGDENLAIRRYSLEGDMKSLSLSIVPDVPS
jgi:4'-phosphopantetheinyl transferase